MKRFVVTFCLLAALPSIVAAAEDNRAEFVSLSVYENNRSGDNLKISVGGVVLNLGEQPRSSRKKKVEFEASDSFGIGFNLLTTPDYGAYPASEQRFLDITGKSLSVQLMLTQVGYGFGRRHNDRISTGLGVKWDNYVFGDITLRKGDDGMIHPVAIDGRYKKSKLTTFSLHLPLTYTHSFGSGKFHLSGGVYGDFALKSFTKYKKPKHKHTGAYGVRVFQPGVTMSAGFRHFAIYCNYSLAPLFNDGVGPKTNRYTIGIKL